MVHGAGAPQIPSPFRGLILVLFSPHVFTPSKRISNRVGTGPGGPLLLVILLLSFSSLLGQSSLDLMLVSLFGLTFLFLPSSSLFILFLLLYAVQGSLSGHLFFVSKCIPHLDITHMCGVLSDNLPLGGSRGSLSIRDRRTLGVEFHSNGQRHICTGPNIHVSPISLLPCFLGCFG